MNNQSAFVADATAFTGIATFASMTLTTQPKLLVKHRVTKEPRPFMSLTKVQKFVNALLGAEYEARVLKQRERENVEGEFTADKASGRTRINALLSHKDGDTNQLYLSVYLDTATFKHTTYHDENGNQYTWEQVQDFLPPPKRGNDKQGIENEIRIICPKLESITEITAFGKTY